MEKIVVQSSKARVPNWPIPQGIKVGDFVFLSGQTSRNPQREVVGAGDIRAQTRQVIESMKVLLEAAGTSLDNIVKVTHYVTDLEGQRVGIREVWGEYFKEAEPASTMVEIVALAHPDLLIEIESIAVIPKA